MSDSELSSATNIPADDEIERSLERVTRALIKDETQDPTINLARSRAEQELGLETGFLKNTVEWKDRSKKLIHDTVEACEEVGASAEEEDTPKKPAPKPKAKPKAKSAANAGKKRKSDGEENGMKKRRKKATKVESEDDNSEPDLDDDEDESDVKPAKKPARRTAKKPAKARASAKVVSDSEEEDLEPEQKPSPEKDDEDEPEAEQVKSTHVASKDESELSDVPDKLEDDSRKTNGRSVPADDESDMSSLIDDPPPKKKRQKKTAAPDTKSKATAKASRPTKSKASGKEVSPDDEEIKRLQGWLVKCGIRKRWHLELANCSTSKEKIKYLKKMLDDAGMTGRYSNEKAKQIKEARELAEEIEAAQEFNERWGQSEGDDDDDDDDGDDRKSGGGEDEAEDKADGPTRRRLPKGFVDFGDSGDDGSD